MPGVKRSGPAQAVTPCRRQCLEQPRHTVAISPLSASGESTSNDFAVPLSLSPGRDLNAVISAAIPAAVPLSTPAIVASPAPPTPDAVPALPAQQNMVISYFDYPCSLVSKTFKKSCAVVFGAFILGYTLFYMAKNDTVRFVCLEQGFKSEPCIIAVGSSLVLDVGTALWQPGVTVPPLKTVPSFETAALKSNGEGSHTSFKPGPEIIGSRTLDPVYTSYSAAEEGVVDFKTPDPVVIIEKQEAAPQDKDRLKKRKCNHPGMHLSSDPECGGNEWSKSFNR
mmetsp:Transcript_63388/g.124497  ORF Transcript_63388/g.124497 Transcript_63388/m.124497 type:complete len:281 (-) Transcript_63388:71-913(-)